ELQIKHQHQQQQQSKSTLATSSSLTTDRQFCFSSTQLKYAISNKLPC
ncbi:unnamed protein product, partial [Rotaria sordida]